tara:strand:+ start:136 stop:480 length:345 start_codon:yes stop_codon:yes gene_type:complete
MDKLSSEEVAILIRARHLLKARSLDSDADITTLCDSAGVSRKTGYEWETQYFDPAKQREEENLRKGLEVLKAAHAKLEKDYDDLSFENDGRKVAWQIHHVDEYLASKKTLRAIR